MFFGLSLRKQEVSTKSLTRTITNEKNYASTALFLTATANT